MSSFKTTVRRARHNAVRLRNRHGLGVRARLRELETEVQEQRQLNRRVAELSDLVSELLVPLARREDEEVEALVQRYRESI